MIYEGLFERLRTYFAGEGVVYVIAPFIRADALAGLLSDRPGGSVIVLTSWRPDDVLAGASDLNVYELCHDRRWRLYTSDSLHAKLYSLDLATAWIGSANITRRALGLADVSNDEVLGFIDPLPAEVKTWVYRLLHSARPVTDELHASYVAWLAEQPPPPPLTGPPEVLNAERTPFSVRELPAVSSPRRLWEIAQTPEMAEPAERAAAEHDLAVFRVLGEG